MGLGDLTLEDIQPMMMMVVKSKLRPRCSKDETSICSAAGVRAEETSFEERERNTLEEDWKKTLPSVLQTASSLVNHHTSGAGLTNADRQRS